MSLQISPVGIAIAFVLYSIAFFALRPVFRALRHRKILRHLRWLLIVLVLLVPWADELWIAWKFNEFCKDAGVRVVRKVAVEGYFDDTAVGTSKPGPVLNPQAIALLDNMEFRFLESRLINGQVARFEKIDGHWRQENIYGSTARYHYKRIIEFRDARGIHHETPVALRIELTGEKILDSKTNEVIGRRVVYKRGPGWIEGLWKRFVGSGLTFCPDPGKGTQQPGLLESVLIPVR